MFKNIFQKCPNCGNKIIGVAERKDGIGRNWWYKEPCC